MRKLKWMLAVFVVCFMALGATHTLWGQDAELPAAGLEITAPEAAEAEAGIGFFDMIKESGPVGVMLWLALLATSVAGAWLVIDAFVRIRETEIIQEGLVGKVQEAMEQGDVVKALNHCAEEPGALANILAAGFSNVEEGFEAIQDSVGIAADLESEKLLQRVAYLNLVGNLAPMMGLLGTVQGMIAAFKNLAVGGGAQSAVLALNISQALFTTAAGLSIAIPTIGFFYFFRNRATNIILKMEGLTLELIKDLRNVEIVEE